MYHHQYPHHQAAPQPFGLAGTPVAFDTRPFQQVQENVWLDTTGDAIVLEFFNIPPDLPAPVEDLANLRARTSASTAQAGMGLVELDVIGLDGMPVIRQMVKGPQPHHEKGMAYLGTYIIPRDRCSVVLKVQCAEGPVTGTREAALFPGFLQHYQGNLPAAMAAWAQHPYAQGISGGLPRTQAEDAGWDAHFPDHPLSRVRRLLGSLAYSLRVEPSFRALPPFQPWG